ncbi:putative ribosome-associated chaperone [Wickerhamomyces ciferrii]|uniref:Ribosome-associated chaperone n=1 Tax=Wickerhamomyces ciferrii (strain ATCC 14091 / BCRC 22168 / CBS 111 / JCM 3599 / NBRC 0793 / NRRL Y-1031 F-60-10) TaxID=1206466 RepID=K0KVZ5_WICCF|nr:putative ribosome-associated chaperone [Wickerhamomyces ciferrii]CCH46152.1 putative ribosome-associated chaperone [Wickerhamomyces ciferrii]
MSLPSLPANFGAENFKAATKYTAPVRRPIEPVGRYFLAHASRALRGHTWSEFEKIEAEKNVNTVDETDENADLGDEEQDAELLAHDPRDWKTADLYAVLGLSHLRYKATEDQIRRAHRKQVLKHHPDKKGAKGGLDQDGFFKIIQKAYETILDPSKRAQYDSVDEKANVLPPPPKTDYDFFEAWTPVVESEKRFAKKQVVPSLGDANTPKAEVEAFYAAFYRIDSWRSFEFLDEDVPDDSSNRDHKRYIERKNVASRKKRKAEDNARFIALADRLRSEDPRIKLFKEAEKAEKERKKWERDAGAREAAAKAQKEAEEAAAKKEAEEKAAAALKADSKKAKEAAKSAKKKNKRAIRGAPKDAGYFGDADKAEAIDSDVGFLIESFDDLQLSDVSGKVASGDAAAIKEALATIAKEQTASGKVPAAILKYFV